MYFIVICIYIIVQNKSNQIKKQSGIETTCSQFWFLYCCRLQFLDVNQSTKNDITTDNFAMTLPDNYKDLHGGMVKDFPKVTEARVTEYLSGFDKQLEEKSKAMYKER